MSKFLQAVSLPPSSRTTSPTRQQPSSSISLQIFTGQETPEITNPTRSCTASTRHSRAKYLEHDDAGPRSLRRRQQLVLLRDVRRLHPAQTVPVPIILVGVETGPAAGPAAPRVVAEKVGHRAKRLRPFLLFRGRVRPGYDGVAPLAVDQQPTVVGLAELGFPWAHRPDDVGLLWGVLVVGSGWGGGLLFVGGGRRCVTGKEVGTHIRHISTRLGDLAGHYLYHAMHVCREHTTKTR